MRVADLPDDLLFVSTDIEVEGIKKLLGNEAKDYDSFFVRIENGEIVEAYGMYGIVPHLDKLVFRVV